LKLKLKYKIPIERKYFKTNIKKCTFCYQLENLKIECKDREENYMKKNKDDNGEKKKGNSKMEQIIEREEQ